MRHNSTTSKKNESTFTLMWYFMLKMFFSNLSIHVITIYSSSTDEVRKLTQYAALVTKMASFSRKVELIFQWSGWECQSEGVQFSSNMVIMSYAKPWLFLSSKGRSFRVRVQAVENKNYLSFTLKIAKCFPKVNLIWP